MQASRLLIVVSFLAFLCGGCSSTGIPKRHISALEGQIKAAKYTPFRPARSSDGAGTIIEFNWRGEETRIEPSTSCIVTGTNTVFTNLTAILDTVYTNTSSGGVELDLGKLLDPNLALGGAFNVSEVRQVKIKLKKPFEEYIYLSPTKTAVRSLPTNSPCAESLKNKSALILHNVLGAEGVEYEFIGSGGKALTLNATILQQINLKPNLRSQYEGKSSLNIDQRILLGYRAWRPNKLSGFWQDRIEFNEVSLDDVEKLRKKAQKKSK